MSSLALIVSAPVWGAVPVLDAFHQSDLVGKAIVLLLLGISVFLWSVMLGKFSELKEQRRYSKMFLTLYRGSAHPALPQLGERKLLRRSPLISVYLDATRELVGILRRSGVSADEVRDWRPGEIGVRLSDVELAAIRGLAERRLAEEQLTVEKGMSRVATVTTAAPSLGLFGTVWGVMGAFMAMGSGGSNMISAVAPGISGALLTTVAGLFVAIPAAIGYNALSDRVRATIVELENFVDEYMADVARIHGVGGGAQ